MNRYLQFLLFSNAINVFADNLLLPLYALFIAKIGGGAEIAGILFGIQFLSSGFFGLLVTRVRDKIALDSEMLEVNFVIKAFAWALLIFSQNIPTMVISQILLGLAAAIGAPAFNALVSENLDSKRHIRDWSIWQLVRDTTIAVASIISGYILSNFGFAVIFIFMVIFELISLILYHLTKKY